MANFIYSIEDFFSKCLFDNNVEGFFIAPYQRGYKWKSATKFDQVPVLLTDLYEAYKKPSNTKGKEYFLQYITVKSNKENRQNVFEVIDGQQRLTTISLLFYVLEEDTFNQKNITIKNDKALLNFARYSKERKHIFKEIIELSNSNDIDFISIKKQDVFYMLQAVICIKNFFNILKEKNPDNFDVFITFIRENVKIILNKEDEYTSAEEVFSSLNSNQVPLTNAYLIKGLLLTKASRGYTENRKKHFKEIMDERAVMGRTWDEMNSWFDQKEIALYFFEKEKDCLAEMLKLINFKQKEDKDIVIDAFRDKLKGGGQVYNDSYELFNHFHDNIITSDEAVQCLNEVKHYFKRLQSWYYDDYIHNLLGYYLLYNRNQLNTILTLSNEALITKLKDFIVSKIPLSDELKDLKYIPSNSNSNKKIQDILLVLSVFPSGEEINEKMNYRFDFKEYLEENWSLEHIFPQNPNSDNVVINDDKPWIIEAISNKIKELKKADNQDVINQLEETKQKVENNKDVPSNSIEFIYNDFTEKQTHSLGNMALLSGSVNSALSNGFFNTKRKILLSRINRGSFVPKHTIDVFSKMLEVDKESEHQFDTTLVKWTIKDLNSHFEWIKNQLEIIKNELSK